MSPVRIPSSHPFSFTGKFPSVKMNRMISYESLLEKDDIYELDFNPFVSCFEEQPMTMKYVFKNKVHGYTFDACAEINSQLWFFECKPEKYLNAKNNQYIFEAAHYWCEERGWRFQVLTERHIRSGFYLKNVKYLTYFARMIICSNLRIQLLNLLNSEMDPISIADIVEKMSGFDRTQVLPAIFKMAYYHEIFMPLEKEPLSPQTPIQISIGKDVEYEQLPFFNW